MVADTIEEIEPIKFAIDPHPISCHGAYFPNKSTTSLKSNGRRKEGSSRNNELTCSLEINIDFVRQDGVNSDAGKLYPT